MRRSITSAVSDCVCKALSQKARQTNGLVCRQFLPGGGAGPDSTPFEKVYVVLEGEMNVIVDGVEQVLGKYDSCTIPPNEIRKIENRSNHACTMLVVIPYPPKGGPK